MSVSAIFCSRMVVPPPSFAVNKSAAPPQRLAVGGVLVIECSSRPQKKATKHHMKTRPRKSCPSDIRRGPAAYPPLPALPPEWSLAAEAAAEAPLQPVQPE